MRRESKGVQNRPRRLETYQALKIASGEVTSANEKVFSEAKTAPAKAATLVLVIVMVILQMFVFQIRRVGSRGGGSSS